IHSFAFEVVRNYLQKKAVPYQIIEGYVNAKESGHRPMHKRFILQDLFHSLVGEQLTEDQLEELLTYISYIKNKMVPQAEWAKVEVSVPEAPRILTAYETFKKSGTSTLLLDFDDMLTLGNQILEEDQALLLHYQNRYDYVLTDESQDTSLVQHALIEKLAKRHRNLCVVADDDQSIYSWRGAEPSYLLNFKKTYSDATILYMEQNYRSSADIVSLASKVIKENIKRYNKTMFTENPKVKPVKMTTLKDFKDQANYLVKAIRSIEKLSEVAVLFRNNSSSIALMDAFDRAGIPFYMKDADNRFFSHWVVKDVLNFMRMSYTDRRVDLLEAIHLKFNGYISKKQMAELKRVTNDESVFDNLLKHVQLQPYQLKVIKESKKTFQKMNGMGPEKAIQTIRKTLGYDKALEKTCERLGFSKDYLFSILNTLEEIAEPLKTMEVFASRLNALDTLLKTSKTNKGRDVVTFSTFHSAKGLEFETVYMIDVVQGVLPSSDDVKTTPVGDQNPDLLEEARRLFYVGMTRAKTHLEILDYREKYGEPVIESQFIAAIRELLYPEESGNRKAIKEPAKVSSKRVNKRLKKRQQNPNAINDLRDLNKGRTVRHSVFGLGTISAIEGERVFIQFSSTEKTLLIAKCLELELLEHVNGEN
ncbi:MAG TPA: ATP-dependent helicase, partial [Candidatus Angelobacter sp.]|nr:ATP-dependent helicase [Candidatus Angelobacter sp.]